MSRRTGSAGRPALSPRWHVALALVLAGLGFGPVAPAHAEITVEAHVDQDVVALGEQATLTVTVNGSGEASRPALPDMPDFRVFPAGTARNFSFVNGRMSSATVYTFLLSPKREGTFTIPPIGVLDGNTRVTSRPLTLTVGPAGQGPPPGAILPPPATPPPAGRGRGNADSRAVFLTAAADPASVFVGEQVTLTVRFYQGVRILERPDYQAPAATGFWVENLPGERTYYTQVEGRQYHVTELRTALFPTAAGELTIGPATVHCVLEQNPFQDPFSLFGSFARGEPRAVESAPIKINVRALPKDGRPGNWSGAVGKFTISARLDPPQVKVGEAASLIVKLVGQGNIRSVGEPKLPDIPGLRAFDSGTTIEDQREGGVFGGVKQLTQVLVGETSGQYPIPAIEYPVFRPDRGTYEIIRTEPLTLTVLEGGGGGAALAAGPGPRVVTPQGRPDLRFIRLGDPGLRRARGPVWTDFRFWLWQLVPVAGFAVVLLFARHRERVEVDLGYARDRRATKEARRRLKTAREHLARNDGRAFYGDVSQALVGYVGDRLNVATPALTSDELRRELAAREIDPTLIEELVRCLERCDRGRFAADHLGGEREVLAKAESLLKALPRAGL
ncbi:MAG TPA: BatD family protein [Candidatus Udaeobacter sp.]|nr:BatD family protein [Candidatus Udaeobacter sp.]